MASRKLEPRVGDLLPGERGDLKLECWLGLPTLMGGALPVAMCSFPERFTASAHLAAEFCEQREDQEQRSVRTDVYHQ